MKKALFLIFPLIFVMIFSATIVLSDSTWWNTNYGGKQQWNFTNDLTVARTNASVVFNISKTYTRSDCKDMAMTYANESDEFTQFEIINTVDNCTVRLFDDWSASGTNSYFVYFNSPSADNSANWKRAEYEPTWQYDDSLGTTQFNLTEYGFEGECNLETRTVDGQSGVTIRGVEFCSYNISDWFAQNGGNLGDSYVLTANVSKEYAEDSVWAGFLWVEMDNDTSDGSKGVLNNDGQTTEIWNETAASETQVAVNGSSITTGTWYGMKVNISSGKVCNEWTNASGTYSQCGDYSGTGLPAGIGSYSGRRSIVGNLTFKNIKGGTYLANRNMTISFGSEIKNIFPFYTTITNSAPTNYSPTTNTSFYVDWSSDVNISNAFVEGNWTGTPKNYSMFSISADNYTYNEILPAGTFYWKSYANDTDGNTSASGTWEFTISPADNLLNLSITPNTAAYPSETTSICSAVSGTPNLYRDGINVSNPETVLLGVGTYNYTCNITGSENYTAKSVTNILIVNAQTASTGGGVSQSRNEEQNVTSNNTSEGPTEPAIAPDTDQSVSSTTQSEGPTGAAISLTDPTVAGSVLSVIILALAGVWVYTKRKN